MEIQDILHIIKKRIVLISSITVMSVIISALISFYLITPEYKSTCSIVVTKHMEKDGEKLQYNDIMMYQKLVKTYAEIAKSRKVAENTIISMGLNIKPEELQRMLTTNIAPDTEVMYISIQHKDKKFATNVVNKLSEEFIKRANELLPGGNIQIIDYAKVPKSPVKPKKVLNMAIAFVLGLMTSLGLTFLLEYLDTTIKTADEIDSYLDIPVIGLIAKVGE
ncbi:YveK family protein [Thermobrachium celere]|uniref:Tyrosine-protein kinase transmembrane modulator EpsC n=1 Tax=Thermobrachium celere DSM 8682 TaxID=941824 RepID=R7RNF0_9CLOT|nr:GNVR domain-containing protein [Thermobrachium celere]CDF57717.1 Tyrosine-protein kinase transmembrane modulator EpsC [Thermobrachium celere DSM 8682]